MPVGKILTTFATLALVAMSPALFASDDHLGQDFAPSASPDGRFVVYYSYRGQPGDLSDLYVVELKTGIERQITNTPGYFEIEPQWSPVGDKIYFAGGPSMKELAIFTIKPDGTGLEKVYDGESAGPPELSQSGQMALHWRDHEDGSSDIFVHNLGSGESSPISVSLGGQNRSPAWAGDGNHVIFSHRSIDDTGQPFDTPQPHDGIYLASIDGGNARKLSALPLAAYKLVWAPDGFIYFMANDENERSQIYRIPHSGGEPKRVTVNANAPAYFPAVSADKKHLLFAGKVASGRTRILSMPLAGGDAKTITKQFAN
ncbi:MAG: PD40 domain-containing protein [Kordiimonadaceae bacterium]|nr:PD40 domain-containing protein [Kordiimonadaceae bacterium]MBO6568057.1 PD40 domain-containing protein [Kordiimonadaceae bacterium]MBO6964213.1 PD40 domain-containing protein [Kordiimonadaceae bacterium]